jgi:hypothetical protein
MMLYLLYKSGKLGFGWEGFHVMKVTNEIGLFTKLSMSLAKQRTEGKYSTQAPSTNSIYPFLSPIQDKIEITSSIKPRSDVQSLTGEMTKKSFSSIKEYGAYFLSMYNKIKDDRS